MSEEEKQLTPITFKTPTLNKQVEGAEDFPNSSVQIPRMIIGQPNNLSGYPEGKFINNLTQETFDSLTVVMLKFKCSRTLWPSGKPNKGDQPECRAQDAIHADIEFLGRECLRCNREHDLCVDEKNQPYCEHAKFHEDFKPECRLAYHFLGISHPNSDIFTLAITGKGISPTNRFMSSFKVKGRPLYSAICTLNLEKALDGNYYVIRFSNFKWLENQEELKKLFDSFKDVHLVPAKEEAQTNEV